MSTDIRTDKITSYLHNTVLTSYNNTNVMYPQMDSVVRGDDLLGNVTEMETTTKSVEALVEYYLNGVTAVVVIFLGLIGNFLTVVVLTRRTMRSSTNLFLTALALWDMMVLLITFLLITLPELSLDYKTVVHPYIVVYVYPLGLVAQTSTVWITVSFTVERYIAVCHPLRAASMCTIERARIVVIAVSVAAFFYNACRWFEYRIDDKNTQQGNSTVIITSFESTPFGSNMTYKKLYFFSFYPFIMFIIPLSTLAILNTCLILAVKRSQKQQKDMNVRQSRENNVTLMLVSVVIVFMMCQVPAMVYNVMYSINEAFVTIGMGWIVLSSVRNFLVTFNSAINFILYCAFGQKFRRIFIRTFCRCFLSENEFHSLTFHGTVAAVTKLDKTNKQYRTLLLKHQGNNIEMSSNITQHTLISKYSPCVSRSPSPNNLLYQNDRQKLKDGQNETMFPHKNRDTEQTYRNRLVINSRTPSPV